MEKKSILLVDNNVRVREMIQDALNGDYIVLEASGYSEAIGFITHRIDLVLTEYDLPDSDGFELVKTMRKVIPALPAIIMTAHSNEDIAIKAIRAEVSDYLRKPLRMTYLKERLSEILGDNGSNSSHENEDEVLKNREELILERIGAYLEENYMKDLTLGKLAAIACMNKFKLCKTFKEKFGQNLISYRNSIRIKNAARLLERVDLNITEVAYGVGYKNVVHFDRVFRGAYGMTPREYRKKSNSITPE